MEKATEILRGFIAEAITFEVVLLVIPAIIVITAICVVRRIYNWYRQKFM